MLATDVAGRGLDFSRVSHVINWELPDGREQYTHRTGRAGRMGRKGIALTLVTRRDYGALKGVIERNNIKPVWLGNDPLKDYQPRQGRPSGQGRKPGRYRSGNRGRGKGKPPSGGGKRPR
jgi:ATP-dependent RNA helicase DeaD